MTRLKDEWLADIRRMLVFEERDLCIKTKMNFAELAVKAAGIRKADLDEASKVLTVAAVPVTTGIGVISTFPAALAAIAETMGFHAIVTEAADVAGILEAHKRGAHILFLADDDIFIAINKTNNRVADNNDATVRGFLAALSAMIDGLNDKDVLVLGCGVIGRLALILLKEAGAHPVAYDSNPIVRNGLSASGYNTIESEGDIKRFTAIFDATNTGGWLNETILSPDATIVTPGVPLSLTEEAESMVKHRLIHDLLPIGVVTMLAMVI